MNSKLSIYREDGGAHRVEILSDATDEKGLRSVKLRCIECLRPQVTPYGALRIPGGAVFDVSQRVGGGAYSGMWTLTLEDEGWE